MIRDSKGRFIRGHKFHLGRKRSKKTREAISKGNQGKHKGENSGKDNPMWKGNKVGYSALHYWVNRKLGHPNGCTDCGRYYAKKFEWANVSGLYKRDVNDWIRLCTSCHRTFDANRCIIGEPKKWQTKN